MPTKVTPNQTNRATNFDAGIAHSPRNANVTADAFSCEAYYNNLVLQPSRPSLCEAIRSPNLQTVPQGYLARREVIQLLKNKSVKHNHVMV